MTAYRAHADPPLSLAERLRQLNDNLQDLAVRLKDAIAGAVGSAVAQAVRDGIRTLLGAEQGPPERQGSRDGWHDDPEGWHDEEQDLWREEEPPIRRQMQRATSTSSCWLDALRTAVEAGLWWLRRQPSKRPILTTALVTVAAGGAALLAGPSFAACVSVIASVASLILTADAARSAGDILGG